MEQAKYVNRFSFVINDGGDETQITFFQNQPVWDSSTVNITGTESTEVCRLIMTTSTAMQLQKAIAECLIDADMKKNIKRE